MLYALDIETTGLSSFKDDILCIGVWNPKDFRVFKTIHDFEIWLTAKEEAIFICHNGSFDINFLRRKDLNISDKWLYDTRSMASILCPRPEVVEGQSHALSLENLVQFYFKETPYKLDRTKMSSYSFDEISAYNLKDCELTYRLFNKFNELIFQQSGHKGMQFISKWLMPATKLCAELEYNGIEVDKEGLEIFLQTAISYRDDYLDKLNRLTQPAQRKQQQAAVKELETLYEAMEKKVKNPTEKTKKRYQLLKEKAITKIEPFNWNSPKQLLWLFKDYYHLPVYNRRTEKYTTDTAKLRELKHPVAETLLLYREQEKLISTCIPALLNNIEADGAVHAHFNVGGTITGRLSSSNPNLQQVPRDENFRKHVQAKKGFKFISLDLAQIEPRLIAEASKDQTLLNTFIDNQDIYSILGTKLFGINCPVSEFKTRYPKERQCAKTLALACFYGVGAGKFKEQIAKDLSIELGYEEAGRKIKDFLKQFPAIVDFKARLETSLSNRKVGYNLLGRPIYIADNDNLRNALNVYIQGSASDLLIYSVFNHIQPFLDSVKVRYEISLLIHDQVVVSVDEEVAEELAPYLTKQLTDKTKESLGLTVPLKADMLVSKEWRK